jgi:hypothetical protein
MAETEYDWRRTDYFYRVCGIQLEVIRAMASDGGRKEQPSRYYLVTIIVQDRGQKINVRARRLISFN